MKKMTIAVGLMLAFAPGAARAALPFESDSMGPLVDVTSHWQDYQPAGAFCIRPDAAQYTLGGTGATATGLDPACRRSGFAASATGLVRIEIRTPVLCAGCRRLFIDFTKIPLTGGAHGHVYYHLASLNPTYTVDPLAHSPNTKNFTNDKLLSPAGSLQEKLIGAFDLHAIAYVTDTAHFVHNALQGPYYIGPWYVNRRGQRVDGVYLDVDVADAADLPIAALNTIAYADGFDSEGICPPSDPDLLYAGCLDDGGLSVSAVDPFAP